MLECNIDDMSGEIYSYLIDRLFEYGAKDVTYTSVFMKKNRPGVKISVLTSESRIEALEKVLFMETSTFGIRKYKVERSVLERKFSIVKTKYGEFTLKSAYYDGKCIKITPEYEECKKASKELDIPLKDIYSFINAYIEKTLKQC